MKRFAFLFTVLAVTMTAVIAPVSKSSAQGATDQYIKSTVVTRTSTNGALDTFQVNYMGSKLNAAQCDVLKSGGTVGGKVYFEKSITGRAWKITDSLALADVATVQSLYVEIDRSKGTSALHYRFRYVPTGGTTSVKFGYVRRLNE